MIRAKLDWHVPGESGVSSRADPPPRLHRQRKALSAQTYSKGFSHLVYEENEQLSGLRLAQNPIEPVNMHGRLVEDVTRTVDLGRIGIDLALDLPSQGFRKPLS